MRSVQFKWYGLSKSVSKEPYNKLMSKTETGGMDRIMEVLIRYSLMTKISCGERYFSRS